MQLGLTTERYFKGDELNWDECRNAYIKPKAPATLNILDHLHKYADYEWRMKDGDMGKFEYLSW